jgi:heat shock protein HslJ
MKLLTVLVVILAMSAVLIAGCTSPIPFTPAVTTVPATPQVTPVPTPLTDPLLLGTWNLKAMNVRGGTALTFPSTQVTITFYDQGSLSGYGGCNNYNAGYTFTGQVLYSGKGIVINPIISTQKYCADSSDTEATYLQILQKTNSYVVNGDTLTITDSLASQLIFKR